MEKKVKNDSGKYAGILKKLRNVFIYHLFAVPFYVILFPVIFRKIQKLLFSDGGDVLVIPGFYTWKASGFILLAFFTSAAFMVSAFFGLIHDNLVADHSVKKPFKILVLSVYTVIAFMLFPLSLFDFTSVDSSGLTLRNPYVFHVKNYSFKEISGLSVDRKAVVGGFVPMYFVYLSDGNSFNLMSGTVDGDVFKFVESSVPLSVKRTATERGAEYFLQRLNSETAMLMLYNYKIDKKTE